MQCDKLGQFLKVLCNKFSFKAVKIFGKFWGCLEVRQFLRKDYSDFDLDNCWNFFANVGFSGRYNQLIYKCTANVGFSGLYNKLIYKCSTNVGFSGRYNQLIFECTARLFW